MSQAATETTATATATGRPAGLASASRSSVLGQFRTNPFRVLRVPIDIGVDQAIWKAEEVLTRIRAGLPAAETDLLPWLPDPDETETRQAVQRIEEPLRRLTDQMFWFDPEHDPDGDLLRRALVTLDPAALSDYLARSPDDVLPRPATVPIGNDVLVIGDEAQAEAGDELTEEAPPPADPVSTAEVPRLIDHANVRLLLATLSLYDALPDGLILPGDAAADEAQDGAAASIEWETTQGREIAEDPHKLDLTGGRLATRSRRTVALWADALARWHSLAGSPAFLAYVRESIVRLEDEVVGEDDAEAIVNSASARVIDMLAGEIKAQLLLGRMARVKVLLEAAVGSPIEPRRWSQAFRPLRPLFRTEADELEPLLPEAEDGRLDDVAIYLSRLGTIKARWEELDPSGDLGLAEVVDECDLKACESLRRLESYPAAARLKQLHGTTMGLASAESLKQKIAATVGRVDGFEHYACHFCRTREMDPRRSVVITGKLESHRTYGFNSTTIHYMMKADIVPRCPRCSDLHHYLWHVRNTTCAALEVAAIASIAVVFWKAGQVEPVALVFLAVVATVATVLVGLLARKVVAMLVTPKGERAYWKAKTAAKYRDMKAEGCKMEIDYRRHAFRLFEEKQANA